jgi:hydrogenase/urease accessory protein HupE
MTATARGLVLLAFLALAGPAAAHAVFGVTGFGGGILHSLAVPSHLMAVLVLGLLIGQQRWGFGMPLLFAVAVCGGLGVIARGAVPMLAEETLLAAAAAIGILVASGWPVLWVVGAGLAAVAGFALALDSPPEAVTLAEANLTLLGTALSAVALLIAVAQAVMRLQQSWQRIGVRIGGSWIAASAILVLALRFLR